MLVADPSPEFQVKLQRMVDPALKCYWNPIRQRFIIDRCGNPEANMNANHHCNDKCRKFLATNVMVVQAADGGYRPLGDDLIDKLRGMDAWANFGTVQRMDAHAASVEKEDQECRDRSVDTMWKEVVKDDIKTLRKAFHLIQQHNLGEIH